MMKNTRVCRWMRAGGLSLLLLGSAVAAQAQNYQITGNVNTLASLFSPGPREDQNNTSHFSWYDRPEAQVAQSLSEFSQVSNGGYGKASLEASIGRLKAFAESSYPSGIPEPHYYGYSFGTAQATFADTVKVSGAGLALGAPVRYELHLWIEGQISQPSFEVGGHLASEGIAEIRLIDQVSRAEKIFSWNAKNQSTGWYSVALDTEVGHDLSVTGMLYALATVDSSATLSHWAQSDFGHTANFYLQTSQPGLNTIGASGHDFTLSAVPEPSVGVLMAAGLMLLLSLQRRRRV
ncbi:PEP-CTERM sorting domain-containing protein [Paucibacter sp. Y2R2-4]|uniref:PEP-CTERM sorting domain-containing protein n=1 Tax=Paucibacter sp. Y2R2-4 TaxID=2893553 RepID=UPI0021E4F1CA|nr:PEP-CTERM sorting domain-containing protein [Paucibacter sp. Y2R2-4]MCV2350906.1 PEP-CTERM sorting domain-containing protein [Paucibacter sp. Y2R2-4]